jgi:hypothetical protein
MGIHFSKKQKFADSIVLRKQATGRHSLAFPAKASNRLQDQANERRIMTPKL